MKKRKSSSGGAALHLGSGYQVRVASWLAAFSGVAAAVCLGTWWLFGMWYLVPVLALLAAALYVPLAVVFGIWQGWRKA